MLAIMLLLATLPPPPLDTRLEREAANECALLRTDKASSPEPPLLPPLIDWLYPAA